MKILPRGITGFNCLKEIQPWSKIRKAVIETVFHCGETVVEEVPCDGMETPNFHLIRTSHVSLLIHKSFPFIAFANVAKPPRIDMTFCDWPAYAEKSAWLEDWEILSADELNQPISEELISDLSKAEKAQIHYWEPRLFGEVMFHYWD